MNLLTIGDQKKQKSVPELDAFTENIYAPTIILMLSLTFYPRIPSGNRRYQVYSLTTLTAHCLSPS
jgi:hypothetical protein